MPIGARPYGAASGPPVGPVMPGIRSTPGIVDELAAGFDVYVHVTVTPAQLLAGVTVDAPQPATRLKVLVRESVVVWAGFDRAPGTDAGEYDLVHPGNGEIDESIPPTRRVLLLADAAAGGTPTKPVEVFLLGGVHTARPS